MSSFKVASHLKSVINTTTPIVLENEKASSPFHIRVSQYPAEPIILTYGANRKTKHQGIIQFDVITAIAVGQGVGQELIDLIISSTQFGNYVDANGFNFIVVKSYEIPAHLAPKDTSGQKYIKSVAVEYEYFT